MDSSIGDMAALGKLLEDHRARLVAMVRRRLDPKLAQRTDPEDIVSDAYFVAERRHAELKRKSSLSPAAWLYRIVLDCLIDKYRDGTREKRDFQRDLPLPEGSSPDVAASLIHSGTSPSQAAAKREMAERMQKALDLLTRRDRDILCMRHYDQLTHREAGEVLGITEINATMRYVRALERLRRLWEHLYGDLELP